MQILEQIIQTKQSEIVKLKLDTKSKIIQTLAELTIKPFFLIAEIKPKSPTAGIIRPDLDLPQIVQNFEKLGASGISVLTDEKYFGGSLELLENIKTNLPILRKEFIISPIQIYETAKTNAKIILFIVKILPNNLRELVQIAIENGLLPIIEVNNLEELNLVKNSVVDFEELVILAINNRNLMTMQVNLQTSLDLAKHIPKNIVKMSLSGIKTIEDLDLLKNTGFDGVLIGESLASNNNFATCFL
jgi:indole-3-glycerol phosphate synthase